MMDGSWMMCHVCCVQGAIDVQRDRLPRLRRQYFWQSEMGRSAAAEHRRVAGLDQHFLH